MPRERVDPHVTEKQNVFTHSSRFTNCLFLRLCRLLHPLPLCRYLPEPIPLSQRVNHLHRPSRICHVLWSLQESMGIRLDRGTFFYCKSRYTINHSHWTCPIPLPRRYPRSRAGYHVDAPRVVDRGLPAFLAHHARQSL